MGTREAWELEHLVDDGEENVAVFLTSEQRTHLIAHSSRPLAALLTGYTHTGARPSELAEATVADFDASAGTITLRHRKGRGAKLRSRAVMLSDEGIIFFRAQARGKLPKAPLISGADGGRWRAGDWSVAIRAAANAANASSRKAAQRIPAVSGRGTAWLLSHALRRSAPEPHWIMRGIISASRNAIRFSSDSAFSSVGSADTGNTSRRLSESRTAAIQSSMSTQ
jgi:integrase